MDVQTSPRSNRGTVLLVGHHETAPAPVAASLQRAGYEVATASSGREALVQIGLELPDVVVLDVSMPDMDVFDFVQRLRADPAGRTVPLIFLMSRRSSVDVMKGLRLETDDCVHKPFEVDELVARVDAKVVRRPVPADLLERDAYSGVLSEWRLREMAGRELEHADRTGRPGFFAVLEIAEAEELRARFGPAALDALTRQLAASVASGADPLEDIGRSESGRVFVLLPETSLERARERLSSIARTVAGRSMQVHEELVWTTPAIGFVGFFEAADVDDLVAKAGIAAEHAKILLDLRPQQWSKRMLPPKRAVRPVWKISLTVLRTPFQICLTLLVGMALPFFSTCGWARFTTFRTSPT
ncbi:response regulator [Streptomyces deserti]